jgi:hypothetical protein
MDIDQKLEITVQKTIVAIARIERFVVKYNSDLNKNQKERIINKVNELQKFVIYEYQ